MSCAWLVTISLAVAQVPHGAPADFASQTTTDAVLYAPAVAGQTAPVAENLFPSDGMAPLLGKDDESTLATNESSGTPWGITTGWLNKGGADGFGIVDLNLNRAWRLPWTQPSVLLTPGMGAHLFSGAAALDLPGAVYDIHLDVACRVLERDRSGVTLGVTPGMFGDFHRVDSRTFQVTGRIIGDFQINSHWTLLGGVAVVRQLRSRWLPVGGVIWTPSDDWQFDLTIPRPRFARRLYQSDEFDMWGYVAGQFGGGSWAVDDGTGENVLLGYSDLRILAGVNLWRRSGRELSCELGYVFSREIAIAEQTILAPSSTWVAQLTIVF